ncbi:Integrator complex subunit 5, partial [Orchesella cincta]
MAFLDKFPKSPTFEELKLEFDKFVNNHPVPGHQFLRQVKDTTHSGMFLLRHMPCARDAVFDFISTAYEEFVKEYIAQVVDLSSLGNIKYAEEEGALLEDIHAAFILYLESCGQIWAPILSQWTLQLLGQLSSQFSNKAVFGHCQSVNEVIQLWIG